ncbi:hypothetical protein A3D05_01345 [Candidatus Gottesmanbacteria bacterium RIFCSPHIGHO2_02_FULL_40_24]|uniref:Uncharacterized protein n=1 Tax=Candidatus Gottesmanbacteria bacterium RIFCSPHIGHO2_01_FULL_40_15 TaxID=1798376 RepID=A0A1F5Z1R0_9BACT|nr:MAG: hypothetical protein A2777_05320 [Candidatus Gottesmanbacteria bacterium RIFCSPHIGHO2_01_FULL_40_15]OGG17120.1 MAG: hypothetical protein A3D05_01345 [Candidatus Gottesmanbacteria bacterium RIFCSPHIGHO2_02_FULL_40_24]OGG21979.1 MAG: hypothetical protein A3B48_06025 [Candidatus Gottesmanbacteria bacterium RIFCSPLOWO2_01_FULL_40_10]OGG23167.1 MAG: hypothetical protein A3E42_03435 [Candidatus Gottesmanbacteria bacterium RIFCSPHIGHO2_12_FULL_40_13]OGG32253.1 MAG: hypothetical protein A3I80_0
MLNKTDLQQIQKIVRQETRKIVKEELISVKKDIVQIRKNMNEIIGFFDTEYMDLRKRVERVEEHLNLPPITN